MVSSAGSSAENRGELMIMPSMCLPESSSHEMSETSPSSPAFLSDSRTLAGSTLVYACVVLSLNAKMIWVPPLKSIVQFMYSPRTDLLMNNEPMAAAIKRMEMINQALNFATNAKLLPGGSK